MNEVQNEGQTPTPTPDQSHYTKWIIIGVGGLALLYGAQMLFSPERTIERALERATGGDVDIDYSGGGDVRIKGEDGAEYNVSTGGNATIPDNWPSSVPLPRDITITYAGSMNAGDGTQGLSVSYTTDESIVDAAEYYKSTFTRNGWEIQGTMTTGDSAMVSATKGEIENVGVYISGADGITTITVNVQQEE